MLKRKLLPLGLIVAFATPAMADNNQTDGAVPVQDLVNLSAFHTGDTTTCSPIFDGVITSSSPFGVEPNFTVPSGRFLVMTDIDWAVVPTEAGSPTPAWMSLDLGSIVLGGGSVTAYSIALPLPSGADSKHVSFRSGIAVTSVKTLCAGINSPDHQTVQNMSSTIRLLGRLQ